MRAPLPGRDLVALALALAAGGVAAVAFVLSLTGGEPAALDIVFGVLAAVAGAACLTAWRRGDQADRGRRPLRSLGLMLVAVTAFTLARVAGDEPWRALLEGAGVVIIGALIVAWRRDP